MFSYRNATVLRSILVFLLTSAALLSCHKSAEPGPADPGATYSTVSLSGDIVLPSGSPRNVNALAIMSPVAAGTVGAGRYQVETIQQEFTTQIAADATGEPVLMGYAYPGQTSFTIDARSTVLAMLMNTRVAYSLTAAGKRQLIAKIEGDPAYPLAVQEVERLLRLPNKALLDTTNAVLGSRIAALFTNASHRTQGVVGPAVLVVRADRVINFTNSGVPFSNVIGIYKDGKQVKQLILDGSDFFAASIAEILDGQSNSTATPATETYTLPVGDGQYSIRIRTGKGGAGVTGKEQQVALAVNLARGALLLWQSIVPQYKGACKQAVADALLDAASNFSGLLSITDPASAAKAVYKFSSATFHNGRSILNSCQAQNSAPALSFLGSAAKLLTFFDYLDQPFQQAGSAMNTIALTAAWMAYPAAQDTCFQATGTVVKTCCTESPTQFALLTGGNSKTWKYVGYDGKAVTPYCGNYDTETYTTSHVYTRRIWGGSPCTANSSSITYELCDGKIGWNGGFPYEILSLTANEFVIKAPGGSGLHTYRFIPF